MECVRCVGIRNSNVCDFLLKALNNEHKVKCHPSVCTVNFESTPIRQSRNAPNHMHRAIFNIVNFFFNAKHNICFVREFHCWNMNEKKMHTHLWIICNLCWLHAIYVRSNLLISFFLYPNLVHGQFDIFTWLIVADRFEAVMHHHSCIRWTQWSTMEHSEPNMKYWKMQRIRIGTHI